MANERALSLARHDGQTSGRLVDEWRRHLLTCMSAAQQSYSETKKWHSSVDNDRQFELDSIKCTQPAKSGHNACDLKDEDQ